MLWTNNGMKHLCFDKISKGSHLPLEKVSRSMQGSVRERNENIICIYVQITYFPWLKEGGRFLICGE